MPIEDKSTEAKQSKGFGGSSNPQPSTNVSTQSQPVDADSLIQVVQNSAASQAVTLVQGADAMFQDLEEAAAAAVIERESQVGVRIMDKVAARLMSQASSDSLPVDASALQSQLTQVLGEVTRSAVWQQCSSEELARRKDLFLTPAEMMKSAKALPGS